MINLYQERDQYTPLYKKSIVFLIIIIHVLNEILVSIHEGHKG